MALEQTIKSVTNRKEAEAIEKQKKKRIDTQTEIKAEEFLKASAFNFLENHNELQLFQSKTKNYIINDILNTYTFYKGLKYQNRNDIKLLLYKKYDATIKKAIHQKKYIDKLQEVENVKEKQQSNKQIILKKQKLDFTAFYKIIKILCIILLIPFIILLGFISAVCKNIN